MKWFRDWWRGWSDDDLASIFEKLRRDHNRPGAAIFVTQRELRAHVAWCKAQYPMLQVKA